MLLSRKGIELIWFEKIDFPKSITEILLNIRIFLENFGSSLKKSILLKLLRTLRRLIFFVDFAVESRCQVALYETLRDERR